jgi:uncharacterized protein involved in exopolysaccharide biosynthesis
VFLLSLVVSTIASFFIDYKYKSSVILFPASSSSVSEVLLTKNVASKDVLTFGEEENVEQMIQVLNSEKLKGKIIEKYDLINHYNLQSAKYPRTALSKKYYDNISFIRTKYLSVTIEVYDTDKEFASNIANDIAAFFDSVMISMHKERAIKAFNIVNKEFIKLNNEIKTLQDSLKTLEKLGVFDFETQSEVLNKALSDAILSNNTTAITKIQNKLDILAEFGGAHVTISNLLEYELLRFSDLKGKYSEAKVNIEQDLPYKFIVSKAYPAEKYSYPIRWVIITFSTFSASFLGLIILILFDSLKKK